MIVPRLEVILVNLISFDYLVRYQAALPVNTLSGYLKAKMSDIIKVTVIDMQELFNNSANTDREKDFNEVVSHVVRKIQVSIQNTSVIVGLSMKWTTQEVANIIIKKVMKFANNKVLFAIGNIVSTYGYQYLLESSEFQNVLAVVGEGEQALVEITKKALENLDDISNQSRYIGIANVAVKHNGKVIMDELDRVDLIHYPRLTIPSAIGIHDKERDVYAIETSRGCPWGGCTFCSIKKQFGCCPGKNQKTNWKWKPFSFDKIFTDLQHYVDQGVARFDIKDSEFFGPVRRENGYDPFYDSMTRAEQFANQFSVLNSNNRATISHVSARVDTIVRQGETLKNIRRREVYELLRKSGLLGLYLGIESGSKNQLRRFGKGITVEENRQAIRILRELDFNLEVGFIFFSPLNDMEDLYNNIAFIEETRLYETDSRIFGSLRVQEGTSYVDMLKKKNLLGKQWRESLSYSYRYKSDEVYFIKRIFNTWEESTIKLNRLLPKNLRLKSYRANFHFLRDVLSSYFNGGKDGVKNIVVNYVKKRREYLGRINDTGGLLSEYLSQAKIVNDNLLK